MALLDYAMADNGLADLEGVPLLFTEDLSSTQAFSATKLTVFVPEEEEDYQLLPQAPQRLLSKQIRALRPRVWQNLQRMASADAKPGLFHAALRCFKPFKLLGATVLTCFNSRRFDHSVQEKRPFSALVESL